MKRNIFGDSTKLLYVQGAIFIIFSKVNKQVSGYWLFSFNSILFLLIFIIYSRIRYNEYRGIFLKKGKRFILIDNMLLLLGIIYVSCMDQFVFKQEKVINIPYVLSIIIFILPSIMRNVKMKQIRNCQNVS